MQEIWGLSYVNDLVLRDDNSTSGSLGATSSGLGRRTYVSADFRRHTLERFITPLLREHDRRQVEVYCYSSVAHPDEVTKQLETLADHWRDVKALDHPALARAIREDRIDVLVDLGGHMGGNCLPTFALKPAPVQAQMYFAGTTGLSAIDYRITDAFSDPPGKTERFHTETLIRLPACAWPYEAERDAPAVNPLPAAKAGFVTFGSMNRTIKVTDGALAVWSRILRSVAGSRLIFLAEAAGADAEYQIERFVRHGVDRDCLEPLARLPRKDYLRTFQRIDLCLDTFPYSGDTTTCDALWMGVPTVTLAGDSFHARRGVSHLSNVGLTQWIAADEADYLAKAGCFAANIPFLVGLRASCRERMLGSPLTAYAKYASDLESAYRMMCSNQAAV